MNVVNFLLVEIYMLCFRLCSRYRKYFLFHLAGIFSFLISGLKHKKRGNKKVMKLHLFKGVVIQFLSMLGSFPK